MRIALPASVLKMDLVSTEYFCHTSCSSTANVVTISFDVYFLGARSSASVLLVEFFSVSQQFSGQVTSIVR